MRHTLFASLLFAGVLYSDAPMASERYSTRANDTFLSATVEIAAVDFCYAGSIVDPTTGESVDLFVICEEDGAEQNMDLAYLETARGKGRRSSPVFLPGPPGRQWKPAL